MSKLFPPRPMLWLPYDPRLPSVRSAHGFLEFVGVTLSYRQVYGSQPDWEDLKRALAPYSLERIVDIACRISASLYGAKLPWDSNTQLRICKGIFGQAETTRILNAAKCVEREMLKDGGRAPLLIFHEQQTLNLLKAAFIIKEIDDRDSSEDLIELGKAFLIVTDLTEGEPGDLSSAEEDDPDYLDRWVSYILANSLFSSGSVGSYALARCHDLYLTDKRRLRHCGSYVDLPGQLKAITGLDPDALWAATFALGSHWVTLTAQAVSSGTMALNRGSYFSRNFSFSDTEKEDFYALCETDVSVFKETVEQRYSADELRPFDVIPFAKWPIVSFNDRVYSTSLLLLMQKLTTGLHHVYLDNSVPANDRQRYLTYMGEVFADYISRCLCRVFPPLAGRYLNFDDLRNEIKGKYCDGLISYGDAVVLIEMKASLFPLEARVGHNVAAIKDRLHDIIIDGAQQIHATIEALRSGWRDKGNIIPAEIRQYYPIVLTLEEIPMNPIIHGEVKRSLDGQGLLHEADVRPLQYFDVGVFDHMEGALQGGSSLRDLLDEKLGNPVEVDDSWGNFLYRIRERLEHSNSYLENRYKELTKTAISFFEKRQSA